MNTRLFDHAAADPMVEVTRHPMTRPRRALAAWFHPAGSSQPGCHALRHPVAAGWRAAKRCQAA